MTNLVTVKSRDLASMRSEVFLDEPSNGGYVRFIDPLSAGFLIERISPL